MSHDYEQYEYLLEDVVKANEAYKEAEKELRRQVKLARESNVPWAAIGRVLNRVSRQAVWERFGKKK